MKQILKCGAFLITICMLISMYGCSAGSAKDKDTAVLPEQSVTPNVDPETEQDSPDAPEEDQVEEGTSAEKPAEDVTIPSFELQDEESVQASSYEEIYDVFASVQDTITGLFELNEMDPMQDVQRVHPQAERFGDPDFSLAELTHDEIQTGKLAVTDGERIYMVSTGELVIISADESNTAELGRAFVSNPAPEGFSGSEIPQAVYADGDLVFVITYEYLFPNTNPSDGADYQTTERVHVKCYDVSDPENPLIVSDYAQSGRYLSSYVHDHVLYLIGAHSVWMPDAADPATFVPMLTQNGEDSLMETDSIWICPGLDSTDYTVVAAIETDNGELLNTKAFTGYHAWSETDGEGLYLARTSYNFQMSDSYTEAQYTVCDYGYQAYTRLICLTMDGNLDLAADGIVEGYLFGDGAMTVDGGVLYLGTVCSGYSCRIFTDEAYGFVNYVPGERTLSNAVYALGTDLTILRSVQDVGNGTEIYNIRFAGDTAYIIGYETLAPCYIVDMGDDAPALNAVTADEAFSHHLFRFGEGQTAGLGVSDESGMLVLTVYGTDMTALTSAEVTSAWQTAMNIPEAVQVFPTEQVIAVPEGSTSYAVYQLQDGQLVRIGTTELGYISADTRAFCIDENWYFCNDAAVVVVDDAFEPLTKSEFAYG